MSSRCRSCDASIFWALTENGKKIPVDVGAVNGGNLVRYQYDGQIRVRHAQLPEDQMELRYVSHFATCPDARRHRK